jgi:hypothetical protein
MRVGMIDTQGIRQRWELVGSKLDERGRPLVDRMAVVELIAATTTKSRPESRERARYRDLPKGHQSQRC